MKKIYAFLLIVLLCITGTGYAAYAQDPLESPRTIYLPILMYHQISADPSKLSQYVISPEEFESDLQLIQQHGYTTITVNDLINYAYHQAKLPEKPIMLTFDDGYESDYVYAFPLLKKYKEKAVFSIIGNYADLYSGDVHKDISYSHLSWDQIKEMHDSKLAEFHHHSYNMHNVSRRRGALKRKNESYDEYKHIINNDLDKLNTEFVQYIGTPSTAFTCPYGFYNEALKQALKEFGFTAVLTTNEQFNKLTGNPEELYSLNRFVRSHRLDINRLIKNWETISAQKQ